MLPETAWRIESGTKIMNMIAELQPHSERWAEPIIDANSVVEQVLYSFAHEGTVADCHERIDVSVA